MIVAAVPSRWLVRRVRDPARAYHLNVLVTSALLLVTLPLVAVALDGVGHCLVRSSLGGPGPFCGVTRSVALTLGGDLSGAWSLHPMGIVVAATLVAQVPIRLRALRRGAALRLRFDGAVDAAIVGGCAIVWVLGANATA